MEIWDAIALGLHVTMSAYVGTVMGHSSSAVSLTRPLPFLSTGFGVAEMAPDHAVRQKPDANSRPNAGKGGGGNGDAQVSRDDGICLDGVNEENGFSAPPSILAEAIDAAEDVFLEALPYVMDSGVVIFSGTFMLVALLALPTFFPMEANLRKEHGYSFWDFESFGDWLEQQRDKTCSTVATAASMVTHRLGGVLFGA